MKRKDKPMNRKMKKISAYISAAVIGTSALSVTAYAENYDIPSGDTWFKSYMDHRAITDASSKQYELQQNAFTDDNGLRKYGDYYLVAMGTYYAEEVGITFRITLDTGIEFNVMTGDIKDDLCTDKLNMYSPVYDSKGDYISANVIEFIVDTDTLDSSVKKLGTISGYDFFKGNITNIERIEE